MTRPFLLLLLVLVLQHAPIVHAVIPCTTDQDCRDQLGYPDLVCLDESKTCSNPFFHKGCFQRHGLQVAPHHAYKKRVCNSDDLKWAVANLMNNNNNGGSSGEVGVGMAGETQDLSNDNDVFDTTMHNTTTSNGTTIHNNDTASMSTSSTADNNSSENNLAEAILLDVMITDQDPELEEVLGLGENGTNASTLEGNTRRLQSTSTSSNTYTDYANYLYSFWDYEADGQEIPEPDFCEFSDFDYPEIRIHQADWSPSVFQAWITQIILMEVVGVPATVGLTTEETPYVGFYAQESTLQYSPQGYPWAAMQVANEVKDCANTDQPCVHVLPEVWSREYAPWLLNHTIELPVFSGVIGKLGLYMSSYTAQEYPELAIYYGLQGEDQREFLARTFKRPTTWGDYCAEVSNDNCTTPDETAGRPPETTDEAELYFHSFGVYQGYFRYTDKNDCQLNPTTCTGHVAAPPCGWTYFLDQQLYWNNIVGLDSTDGPLPPNGGYSSSQLDQLYRAANATRSHVILGGANPDLFAQEFFDSDARFQQVLLPAPTDECLLHRTTVADKCSNDTTRRRGDAKGACDAEHIGLVRLLAMYLEVSNDGINNAERSPAHDLLQNIKISALDMNAIFRRLIARGNDNAGADAREAVCEWLVEHYNRVESFIPDGYPRTLQSSRSQYEDWYMYLAQLTAIFVGLIAVIGMILTFVYRETKVMLFAQPTFVNLILFGFVCNCVGAFLVALEPTDETCVTVMWFIVQG